MLAKRINQLVVMFICMIISVMQFNCIANNKPELVLSWEFAEGKGNLIKDSSGNGYDGLMMGGRWVKSGKGYAVEWIDGSPGGITLYYEPYDKLNIDDVITVEMWVKLTEFHEGDIYGDHRDCDFIANDGSWRIRIYPNGTLDVGICYGENSSWIGLGAKGNLGKIPLNTWTHIAWSYDSETRAFYSYINGKRYGRVLLPEYAKDFRLQSTSYCFAIRPDLTKSNGKKADDNFIGAVTGIKVWKGAKSVFDLSYLSELQ